MTDRFNTAIEARDIMYDLQSRLIKLPYNPDLRRLHDNIVTMINQLSSLEVEARRTKNTKKVEKMKDDIANSIKHLEHYLIIAQIML
jgi:hypothetical protein